MTLHLHIYLLGTPYAERDGNLLEVDTRKALAMLAYLALEEGVHTREELGALLWPEFDERRARAALRRTLSVLKKGVGDGVLAVDRDSVALHAGAVWIDVVTFQQLQESDRPADLEAAAALYRDDFMTGFTLRDAPPFDEWQYYQGETWRRALARLLERLAQEYIARGTLPPAVVAARRWLTLDPLREEAHQLLMRLFAWQGDRSAALRQYRICLRVLDEELGVAPLAETTALYTAIRENELAPPVTPRSAPPAPVPSPAVAPLPLVGRDSAWRRMVACYEQIGAGGRFLAVEGEAGLGKSRLLAELGAWAGARGSAFLALTCYQGESGLAYAPLIDALRRAIAEPGAAGRLATLEPAALAEAVRLLPALASLFPDLPPLPPLSGPAAQGRFCDAISRLLAVLVAGEQPGLLLVDDAHWLDEATLDVLAYLARRLQAQPLLLVLAWRPEALEDQHRLRQLTPAARLSLERLSAAEVAQLVAAAGVDVAPSLLFAETEGVPYFVVEYLEAAREAGDAGWQLPPSVRELLRARLAAVDGVTAQLLQTAAVIGRGCDYELLLTASGRSEDEVVAALEQLLGRRLLWEQGGEGEQPPAGPRYDFTHHKLRAVVYEEMSLVRRRLLHRRVAESLAAQASAGAGLAGQIATHFRLGGADLVAADYYVRAGDHARALFANREALQHYQSALALGYPRPAQIHEAMGDLHTLGGDYGAALTAYETAAALAEQADLGRLEHRLGLVYQRRGEWSLAADQFRAAAERWQNAALPRRLARLYADWSRNAHQQGADDEAGERGRRALQLATEAGDPAALAQAHNMLGMLARRRGDLGAAHRHLAHSLNAARDLADPAVAIAARNNLALVEADAGRSAAAEALLLEALDLCVTLGDRHREAALHNNLADLYHRRGDREASMARLKQAVTIYAEIGAAAEQWQPEIWKLSEW